ncbi:MAG: RsmE family RNA methyltransferase [Actinobacteria bacterium]|uniref:16S rRNA (uracil(1498)-N(3))-methyltransferase n=1 Tax=freshwater metagenome TaxID=449393 RepID=A0A6J7PMY7_9ZZZZ|nr:RsmE family RNA methyltransferase [Actinomycetota bacterium]MSW77531.1 RsmE family RNA methyltransferase [Actinomycetota bacterium]MSZ82545.1 RsmE family RNA methyltransferase [Actinomycetota bacterium]MTB17759.1 RsmE family RNA methyltransferase [Actinomycetota bacterium]
MNPALRTSAAHVFVTSLDAPELNPDDAHHLLRVLRLRDGEVVTVSDGNGGWRQCTVAGGGLVPVGAVIHEPVVPAVTIAAAIPKGDRVEWMVQKLTEVGVGEIVLLHCARSAVRWEGERGQKQLAKLRKIAREAAMQSRRVWLPTVSGPVEYAEMAAREGAVIAEPDGPPFTGATVVIVGPEGGFTPDELALAQATVSLSAQVLRVETAAVVAAVLA